MKKDWIPTPPTFKFDQPKHKDFGREMFYFFLGAVVANLVWLIILL